jgi:histidinol-phosphatase (PHP family)
MTGTNFHTHSSFSDGKSEPEASVIEAIRLGMNSIGFSDHAPMPFINTFSIQSGNYLPYCKEIRRLQNEYAGKIDIYLGLEIDFIPGMMEDFAGLIREGDLDYAIGSVHLIGSEKEENLWFTDGPKRETYDDGLQKFFGGDIRKAVKAFYDQTNRMIETQPFDVIGHFDKVKMHNQNRYFTEDEKWYTDLIDETLELIQSKQIIVEVNSRGLYKQRSTDFFPSVSILQKMHKMGIPLIISSDAHLPQEIQMLFSEAVVAVKSAGYQSVMKLTKSGWTEQNLN